MQQDHLKLEEACVMVNGDQIKLPPQKVDTLTPTPPFPFLYFVHIQL